MLAVAAPFVPSVAPGQGEARRAYFDVDELSLSVVDPEVDEPEPVELESEPVELESVLFLLWCFLVVCFFVVVVDDDGDAELPVSEEPVPLMVDPVEPVVSEDPVDPLIPDDEPMWPDEPLVPDESLLVPDVSLLDPLIPPEPVAPFDMMSSDWTFSVSPAPEKLARTWSPSLMSSIEARVPSRITCVPESTFSLLSLPDSVSVLFERSKFWTLPERLSDWLVVVPEGLLDAVAPLLPIPVEPEPVLDDPVVLESRDVLPRLPCVESLVEPGEVEPEPIDDPDPIEPDLLSLLVVSLLVP